MSQESGRVLLHAAVVCLTGFLLLTAIVTLGLLERVDGLARALVHQSHHPLLGLCMEGASLLWGYPGQIAVGLLGFAMLWPRRPQWALALPIVLAGAGLIQGLAKWALDRPRPNLDPWGFPSGHVLTLVVLLGYLAYVVCMSSTRRRWRCLAVGLCAATVGTVAYSRVYLDAHWLSDVLGGMSGGLAYLLLAIWLIRSIPSLRTAPTASGPAGVPVVTAESLVDEHMVAEPASAATTAALAPAGTPSGRSSSW